MTRILVADDDRTTRLLLSETLRAQKFTIVSVEDGVAALKKINAGKFDLVLLDIWMPKMNGLEVLKKIRDKKNRPKVIVMTSDDAPETLLSAIREEAYQYIAKPIEPRALVSLVRETLAKKSRGSSHRSCFGHSHMGRAAGFLLVGRSRAHRKLYGPSKSRAARRCAAGGGPGVS